MNIDTYTNKNENNINENNINENNINENNINENNINENNTSKQIKLYIPINKTLPNDIYIFSPDELYEMIIIGYNSIIRGKTFICNNNTQNAINKLKHTLDYSHKTNIKDIIEKYELRNNEISLQLLAQKELYYITTNKFDNDKNIYIQENNEISNKKIDYINIINTQTIESKNKEIQHLAQIIINKENEIYKLNENNTYTQQNINSIIQQKIEEAVNTATEKERNDNIQKTQQIHNTIELLNKSREAFECANIRQSTAKIGRVGEQKLGEFVKMAFRDFEGYQLIDVHTFGGHGDFHIKFKNFTILADSKLYSMSVGISEREKIKKDLLKNDHIHFAWLVSLETNIDKFDKAPFMFEWITHNKCVCYINSLAKTESPIETLRCVWYMCNLLYNILVDDDTNNNKCEFNKLKEYKLGVQNKLKQYNKFTHERDTTIINLKGVLKQQDNIVKELLNEETNKFTNNDFTIIIKWWNKNIQNKENNQIKSTLIWTKFKKDLNNLNNNEHKITVHVFKDVIRSFINPSDLSCVKNKDCAFNIQNIGWKEIHSDHEYDGKVDIDIQI
jgi:hypothetical protein